jgi:hypothetical protein
MIVKLLSFILNIALISNAKILSMEAAGCAIVTLRTEIMIRINCGR